MKTSSLTVLLLASVIWNAHGDTNPPVYLQTNGLNIVVRSPSFAFTNHAMRPLSGAPSLLSTRLTASNRLASAAALARNASPSNVLDVQRMQLTSDGARASFGLHKAGFAGSLGGAQPVSITTPDNHGFSFRPTLLAYYDTASGQTVPLGEVQDCGGGVQWPDRVIYSSAFSNLNADVQYICTANSLEQNIILRQRPPAPENFGLNPETTRLEVWTEWFGTPPVRTQPSVITLRAGTSGANAVTATDTALDFGTMKIVRGRAFNLDGAPAAVPVAKEWAEVQGNKFLLEAVDYRAIEPNLETLTAAAAPAVKKTYASREQMSQSLAVSSMMASGGSRREEALTSLRGRMSGLTSAATKSMDGGNGVVLDFTIIDAIPLPANAIEWWPAGGDANDIIGGNNGIMMNGATFGAGEVGQGFSVDGVSSYVKIPSSTDPTGPFTIEFWMKADPNNPMTSMQGLVTGDFYGIEISPGWGGNNGVNFFISPNGYTWNMTSTPNGGGAVVSAGEWHHIAGTYDGTNMQLYVDGQAWGYACPSGPAAPTAAGSFLTFGSEDGRGCPGRFFNGILDEVTIYNRALSPSEIQSIYIAGGAGKDNPQCVAPSSNAIGWWAGDGTADDLISTNNGTLQGNATYSSGEVAQAFDLDGDNSWSSYVAVPDNDAWAFGNNDFTIECWVNLRSLDEYQWWDYPDAVLVANDEGGGDVNKWIFGWFNGTLTLLLDDPVNGPVAIGQAPFNPDMNAWYHLALTRQGTTFTTYVNGVPIGTDTSSAFVPNANAPLTIGQAEGIGFVNGQIDEMTIYNRALSGSEISAIYSAGGAGKCKTGLTQDGLAGWWEWYWFGTFSLSGTNLDTSGNTLLYDYQNGLVPANLIQFTVNLGNQNFNTPSASGSYVVLAGYPGYEAVLINDTNYNDAVWQSYDGIVHMSLGPTDGVYQVWFGLKGYAPNAQPVWFGTEVTLNRAKPRIFITNPATNVVATPYIQVQGYSALPLATVMFDVSNAVSFVTNQPGAIIGHTVDTNTSSYTTDYFQCYDIRLTNGANAVTLHCTDPAGNVTLTNLNITLDYTTATNPVIQLGWPQDGMQICQTSFTLRGWTEDASATVMAQITDTNGDTNVISGIVERTGVLWVNNLPLAEGTNVVTLWVTNSAGLSSETNISVVKDDMTLTLTNINGDLWLPAVSVSGLISDTTAAVWVNGVQGTNYGNGNWEVDNVPVSPGGVASFDLKASSSGGGDPDANATANKSDEMVMDSDVWGDYSVSEPEYYGSDGVVAEYDTGTYSLAKGGSFDEQMQFVDHTEEYEYVLAPGGAATDLYYSDSWGNTDHWTGVGDLWQVFTPGPGGTYEIDPVTEGSLNAGPQEGYASQGINSNEKMMFFTGGPGVIGQQVLLGANASAQPEMVLPNYISGGSPFDYTQITIGQLGQEGSDGWAYGVVANGTPADVTPTANAPMYYSEPDPTEYTPQITANYQPLDPASVLTNADFCVGQNVSFTLSGLPYNVTATNSQWSFGGTYFNNQTNAVPGLNFPACSTVQFVDSGLLTSNETTAWWVSGGANNDANTPAVYSASVECDLIFANGNQSQHIKASGEFNMFRPTAKITPLTTSVTVHSLNGHLQLIFSSDTSHNGITFYYTLNCPSNFPGSPTWVQVDSAPFGLFQDTNSASHVSVENVIPGPYLDTSFPYNSFDPVTLTNAVDSPGLILDTVDQNKYMKAEEGDSMGMWMLFQANSGNHLVPLRVVNWSWSGSATNGPSGWQRETGNPANNPNDSDTETYPFWRAIVNPTSSHWVPSL